MFVFKRTFFFFFLFFFTGRESQITAGGCVCFTPNDGIMEKTSRKTKNVLS